MKTTILLPLIGGVLLCACQRQPSVPDGTIILDEEITLVRNGEARVDEAWREITVDDDAWLVAIVDENLTDVGVALAANDTGERAPGPVEVENRLSGAGVEIAALRVREESRVRITLAGGSNAAQPGKVRLRVQQFSARRNGERDYPPRLRAYQAWSLGTDAKVRTNQEKEAAAASMGHATGELQALPDAQPLAATAAMVHARQLVHFKLHWEQARDSSRHAAAAFAALPQPDTLNEARAKLVEARVLAAMSTDTQRQNPTAAEAMQLARESLLALGAPTSALGPVERARAIAMLGLLDVQQMLAADANRRFEEARVLFAAHGFDAGELEMRVRLAFVLVEQGRFYEAARAFDSLLPELDRISDRELRVNAYIAAARGQAFAGRVEEATDLLLKALPVARDLELQESEATALSELGNLNLHRGDLLQARSYYDEALNVAREGRNVGQYATALAAAGQMARNYDDMDRAFRLHEEAVRIAPTPVLQVRTRLDLGADHYRVENVDEAIRIYREALAIDLHDPMSHIYTDGKLGLARFLVEYEKSSAQDLADADRLIREGTETSRRVNDDWRVTYGLRVRAQLDARQGREDAALKGFETVLVRGRAYREKSGSVAARSTLLRDEQEAFYGLLDLALVKVAARGPGIAQPISASELAAVRRLERARQETFGSTRIREPDAATAARVDALLGEMADRSVKIASMLPRVLDAAQMAELRALQVEMARMHTELDLVRARAASQQSQDAATDAAQSWRPLSPGAAQLTYALGRKHVYATVRSASGTRITVLSASRRDLEKRIGEIGQLDMRADPARVEAALASLSPVLLPAGLLPEKSTAVEIVSEGRIAGVPFAALRSPADPQRRLIETHDVAMITSLVDIDEAPPTRHARPYRLVALASGSGTYRSVTIDPAPRLQAATQEIKSVAALFVARDPSATIKLLTGPAGNAAALRDIWSSGVDVVHFATHALADLRQPIASLLVLPATDASGKTTYLTAGQIQGWHGDAELVFLSACDSAIGPPQFAVGMPGLQRAFLRAGARGVIATLAPIEDVLAREFAADFYARYTGGQSALRALGETQRAWLAARQGMSAEEQLRRRIMALSHAYFAG